MLRRLLTLLTPLPPALSAALRLGGCFSDPHRLELPPARHSRYAVWSSHGKVCAGVEQLWTVRDSDPHMWEIGGAHIQLYRRTPYATRWRLSLGAGPPDPSPGARLGRATLTGPARVGDGREHRQAEVVYAPHWLLALAVLPLPAGRAVAWLIAFARFCRRRGRSLCPQCGYDLRATP